MKKAKKSKPPETDDIEISVVAQEDDLSRSSERQLSIAPSHRGKRKQYDLGALDDAQLRTIHDGS